MNELTAKSRSGHSLFSNLLPWRSRDREGCGMAILSVLLVGIGLGSSPVLAQQGNTGMFWQCAAPSSSNPNGGYCPVNTTYPLPVTGDTVTTLAAVAGTQRGTSIASATALTIPATATVALIQAQGTNNSSGVCLYWQDDGTNPTASAGLQMPAGTTMFYKVSLLPAKFIAATGASCTLTASYYK